MGAAIFASRIAKPEIKAADSPTRKLVPQRSTTVARPFGVWGKEAGGDHEQEAEPTLDRAAPRGLNWSLSRISILHHAPPPAPTLSRPPAVILQPKLAIGSIDDPLEHEADRVADQVMRTPTPEISVTAAQPIVSRKCAECEEEEKLQKKEAGPQAATNETPAIVHAVLGSPGQPLDAATRAYFEPRFGYDFSEVRIHADALAAASAREVKAQAYTVGHDIVFGAGRLAPGTHEGRRLLAHELTHTVQQSSIGHPSNATVREAENAPMVLQRKIDPAACLAQKDEILPPIGLLATIDRELTLTDKLGSEYGPLKKQILANTEARKFVCEAGVPAVLALWDKRTAAGALDVPAARSALHLVSGTGSIGSATTGTGAAAKGCTYSVTYANQKEVDCDKAWRTEKGTAPPGPLCGKQVIFEIVSVSASESSCPLVGLEVSENVATIPDTHRCTPPDFKWPPPNPCKIGPGGKVTGCTDTLTVCGLTSDLHYGGCEEVVTQDILVDGNPVEKHTITFELDVSNKKCNYSKVTRK